MICTLCSIGMARLLMSSFLEIEGLVNRGVLHSYVISIRMKQPRRLKSLMGKLLMGEKSWFSSPNMVLMPKKFKREGYLSQLLRKEDQEALVLVLGIGMTIEKKTLEGEVAVGAGIGMIGIGLVVGTEIIVVEAGATVEAQPTAKIMAKEGMMMKGEAGAGVVLVEVCLLLDLVQVQGEAQGEVHHLGDLQGLTVQLDVVVMSGLSLGLQSKRAVHENILLIPAASLLANLMWMSDCCCASKRLLGRRQYTTGKHEPVVCYCPMLVLI